MVFHLERAASAVFTVRCRKVQQIWTVCVLKKSSMSMQSTADGSTARRLDGSAARRLSARRLDGSAARRRDGSMARRLDGSTARRLYWDRSVCQPILIHTASPVIPLAARRPGARKNSSASAARYLTMEHITATLRRNTASCLAALSVQRTESAAEGRLSQNTTLMCPEFKDPNPQQDRGGDCSVCVRDDGLNNLLSLLSAKYGTKLG